MEEFVVEVGLERPQDPAKVCDASVVHPHERMIPPRMAVLLAQRTGRRCPDVSKHEARLDLVGQTVQILVAPSFVRCVSGFHRNSTRRTHAGVIMRNRQGTLSADSSSESTGSYHPTFNAKLVSQSRCSEGFRRRTPNPSALREPESSRRRESLAWLMMEWRGRVIK